jgi:hypothetical protein
MVYKTSQEDKEKLEAAQREGWKFGIGKVVPINYHYLSLFLIAILILALASFFSVNHRHV